MALFSGGGRRFQDASLHDWEHQVLIGTVVLFRGAYEAIVAEQIMQIAGVYHWRLNQVGVSGA